MGTNTNSRTIGQPHAVRPQGTRSDGTRALDALRHLVRALAGSSRAVEAGTGISGAQLFVLRTLSEQTHPVSVNDLAELTLTHQSTVSGVVTRLVDQALVKRTRAAGDARRVELVITARGRTLLGKAPPTIQTQLVEGIARLPAAQRRTLADTLEAWLDASGIDRGTVVMFHEHDGR
ncbi:MarR family winged helix-turn-helix transcriptional regulator [Gemmatimonas aurantiaca]|uniref:MarR family winged helix-turn-helix transcriptional regulator n=1 Tax=Gemmatimonas aurantiaca TaxID=173480 RepID=UPI00301BC9DE